MAERLKTNLAIDRDLLKRAKMAALDSRSTLTDTIESALRLWLDGASPPGPLETLKPSQRALVERYARALRDGRDPQFLNIIETMLDRIEADEKRDTKIA